MKNQKFSIAYQLNDSIHNKSIFENLKKVAIVFDFHSDLELLILIQENPIQFVIGYSDAIHSNLILRELNLFLGFNTFIILSEYQFQNIVQIVNTGIPLKLLLNENCLTKYFLYFIPEVTILHGNNLNKTETTNSSQLNPSS